MTAPKGTVGRIGIPKVEKTITSITINGKVAWDGTYHAVAGIEDAAFVYFTDMQPGTYDLTVTYQGTTPAYDEPPVTYAAQWVKHDTTTSGNWGGTYGKDGYVLCNYHGEGNDEKVLPAYVTSLEYYRAFPHSGVPDMTVWAAETADQRALAPNRQNTAPRKAACYSNVDQTMTLSIGIKGIRKYHVALYFIDWDKLGSRQAVEMLDAATLNMIAPVKIVNHHSGGVYVVYTYDTSAKFRFNKVRGDLVTLSGIFFDPAV